MCVCVCYLHQSLHLAPVCIQLLSQTASLHTELSQLGSQRSHHFIETHLNTQHKEMVTMWGNSQIDSSSTTSYLVSLVTISGVQHEHAGVRESDPILTATYSCMEILSSGRSRSSWYLSWEMSRSLRDFRSSPAFSHSCRLVSSSCCCLSRMASISCLRRVCCFLVMTITFVLTS